MNKLTSTFANLPARAKRLELAGYALLRVAFGIVLFIHACPRRWASRMDRWPIRWRARSA